jgi:endoglucanase
MVYRHSFSSVTRLLFFWAIFSTASICAQPVISAPQKKALAVFQAGVNISLLENYWSSPDDILNKSITNKIVLAKQVGFKTIRLPINFDHFISVKNNNKLDDRIIEKVAEVYDLVDSLNMILIITYHFGQADQLNGKSRDERLEEIAQNWTYMINYFKGTGYSNLGFALYNEPRITGSDLNNAISVVMDKVRALDLERYWIIGSGNYSKIDDFYFLKKFPNDPKILYTFHFYEPYMFTHQGAPWDKDKVPITGLPFPFDVAAMPGIPVSITHKDIIYNYQHYEEVAHINFFKEKVKFVADWAKKNNVAMICTEFGAIETIPAKYRNAYIKELTEVLTSFGIPAIVWELDQNFKIVDDKNQPLSAIQQWIKSLQEPLTKN